MKFAHTLVATAVPTLLLLGSLIAAPLEAEVSVDIEIPGTPARATVSMPAAKIAESSPAAVVLPFFASDTSNPVGMTTFYAVRNNSANNVVVRYSYFSPASADPVVVEQRGLGPHEVRTVNVRAIPGLTAGNDGVTRGFMLAEAIGSNLDPKTISGDFFRVDAQGAEANGGALIPAESTSCRRWTHRFLSGGGFDGGTRVAFLALDPPANGPVVVGNVHDEAGNQVATVSIRSNESTFEISDVELELPVPFGAIDWVFQGQAHGAVSTTFTANGLLSVGMEAECTESLDADTGEPVPPNSVVFELPGNFLTCNRCGNWQYDMPFGGSRTFSRVEIDFDMFVAGWDPSRTGGFHNIMWLNNGTRWQDMMGYINTRGTRNINTFQVNGPLGNPIGVEQVSNPTVEVGKSYHVRYVYDTVEKVVFFTITDHATGQQRVADLIRLPQGSGPIRTNFAFIQFGSQPGGAVESLTERWRWSNFRAVWVP